MARMTSSSTHGEVFSFLLLERSRERLTRVWSGGECCKSVVVKHSRDY